MSKNTLNECNGCVVINNNQNISLPGIGHTNSYEINFEKPCFFINNHFLSPVLRCYNVILPNPVSLEYCDKLRIKIKIPKQIFGEKYGYSLDCIGTELIKNDFSAGLQLKSSDGCIDTTRCINNDNELEIEDFCGWINITIHYQVGNDQDNPKRERICNLCEISYSLCFSPIKMKALYGVCYEQVEEVVHFLSETCLELENNLAIRYINITNFINNEKDIRIVGPENFICLKLMYNENFSNITFDKFSKFLIITGNDFNINDFNTINNTLPDNNKFIIQCKNESNEWITYNDNIILIDSLYGKIIQTNFLKCNE